MKMEGIFDRFLADASAVSLDELDKVSLLHRRDTKFLTGIKEVNRLLPELTQASRILEIAGVRTFGYRTHYFDTSLFDCYTAHHCGRTNRVKIRSREYLDSGLCYDEIKHKRNRGETVKSRRKRSTLSERIDEKFGELVSRKCAIDPDSLQHALTIEFDRQTFTDRALTERLTIDSNLRFTRGEQIYRIPGVAIIELKQSMDCRRSPLRTLLTGAHIQPASCSKYCIGLAQINESIRKNRFKPLLAKIEKLEKEYHYAGN